MSFPPRPLSGATQGSGAETAESCGSDAVERWIQLSVVPGPVTFGYESQPLVVVLVKHGAELLPRDPRDDLHVCAIVLQECRLIGRIPEGARVAIDRLGVGVAWDCLQSEQLLAS